MSKASRKLRGSDFGAWREPLEIVSDHDFDLPRPPATSLTMPRPLASRFSHLMASGGTP